MQSEIHKPLNIGNDKFSDHKIGDISFSSVEHWWNDGIIHGFCDRSVDTRSQSQGGLKGLWRALTPGGDFNLHLLKQIHSTVVEVLEIDGCMDRPQADAWLVSAETIACGHVIGIETADCLPLILVDKRQRWYSVVHAGWKGVVGGILESAVKEFLKKEINPIELELAIGPGAGSCCYEIGVELVSEIDLAISKIKRDVCLNVLSKNLPIVAREGKLFADLPSLVFAQAISLGLEKQNIFVHGACSICDERYFSFRREKEKAGRQLTFLGNF